MAQIKSNWTAPTFSFDAADQPTAWEDFSIRALDYLETLRMKPDVEDREMKGWTEIKMMFIGGDRRALQTLIDNDTITEADQRTPILALKAIQKAIEDGKHHLHHKDDTPATTTNSTTTTKRSTKCPWKQLYKRIIKYMDSLHEEPLEPQMKIDTFVSAIRNTFPIETSTKQTQTPEQPKKMAQTQTTEQLSSNTPNSDTDSVYSTESDSNDAAHLPRPSYMPKPTKNNSTTSHLSTSTHQPKLSTPTASTYQQHKRKTPLLPTPPSPARNFNYRNHYKQHIPGPTSRYSTYPTFTRHHHSTTHIQPFQDQQTTDTTHNNTFQDHSSQDHTNRLHYYQYQHLQDHTSRYQDTFNRYTTFQSYYRNRHNITPDEERN